MKFMTKEEEKALWNANVNGGLRGLAYAAAVCGPGFYALQRYSPKFRTLPLPLKAFGLVVISVPLISVTAEKAGEAYERSLWTGAGVKELETKAIKEQQRWDSLTTSEKVRDWASNHQYSIVGGSWAASMIVAGAIVARNPYLTFPQKLVQARMWAQGLTVGVLIGSGVVAGMSSDGEKHELEEDHSWKEILDEQEKEQARSKSIQKPTN